MTAPIAPTRRVLTWWLGLMLVGGLGFGLNADRRPLGDDILAHPLIIFFALVGIGLLVLRAVLQRPVPEILPERILMVGCAIGVFAYLIGNWLAAHLLRATALTAYQG